MSSNNWDSISSVFDQRNFPKLETIFKMNDISPGAQKHLAMVYRYILLECNLFDVVY